MSTRRRLRIACTIGPVEAGLLPALERRFTAATGIEAAHEALGSGAALERARSGGIDLVIAHAPALERAYVADGWASGRHPFAASTFVLAGPAADPAGVRDAGDAVLAFRRIHESGQPFLSRGDRSGTHLRELELWRAAGVEPAGSGYRISEAGPQGSAATARDAARQGAYTLLDWASLIVAWPALVPLVTGDPRLLNIFAALPLDPRRASDVDAASADAFVKWVLGAEGQGVIRDFGRREHGVPLFLSLDRIPRQSS